MTPKVRQIILWFGLMLLLSGLQITLVPLLSVYGVVPSLLLIGTVFVSVYEGQITGMLLSFPAGLLVDAYFSAVVGITPLGLTLAAFIAGFFHDEEKHSLLIRTPKMMWIVLLASLVFHTVYVFSYFRGLGIEILSLVLRHVVAASAYTTLLAVIPLLFLARKSPRLKV
jgi:rod shape-determining protein MreD